MTLLFDHLSTFSAFACIKYIYIFDTRLVYIGMNLANDIKAIHINCEHT